MPRYTAPAGEVIDGTKINERCVQKGHGDSVEGVEERVQPQAPGCSTCWWSFLPWVAWHVSLGTLELLDFAPCRIASPWQSLCQLVLAVKAGCVAAAPLSLVAWGNALSQRGGGAVLPGGFHLHVGEDP